MAPPRKWTQKIINETLNLYKEGSTVREACKSTGIPKTTFLDRVMDTDQYAHAKHINAEVKLDEMWEYEKLVLAGKIDPNAYRHAMENRKWMLERMHPELRESKKIEIEATTTNTNFNAPVSDFSKLSDEELYARLQGLNDGTKK